MKSTINLVLYHYDYIGHFGIIRVWNSNSADGRENEEENKG